MADQCRDILTLAAYSTYSIQSDSQWDNTISQAFSMCYSKLQQASSSVSGGLSIPIPLADQLLNLGANAADSQAEYQQLRATYQAATTQSQQADFDLQIKQRIVKSKALDDWLTCMLQRQNEASNGLVLPVTPPISQLKQPTDQFTVTLTYNPPFGGLAPKLAVSGFTVSGASPVAPAALSNGAVLDSTGAATISQVF